jgi:hypothetical protein
LVNLGGPPSVKYLPDVDLSSPTWGFLCKKVPFAGGAGYACRGGTEGIIAPEDLMQLTKSLLGFWLPRAIQDQVDGMDEEFTGQQASGTDNSSQRITNTGITGDCPI